MDLPIPLAEESHHLLAVQGGTSNEQTVRVVQDYPLPCTVTGIFARTDLED
jgi:hypothetical protein